MKQLRGQASLWAYLKQGYQLWKNNQNRYSWLFCPICNHDLNGDNDSFVRESKDHMFWNYKCFNCGCKSRFGLWFIVPLIYSHQKFNKKLELTDQESIK